MSTASNVSQTTYSKQQGQTTLNVPLQQQEGIPYKGSGSRKEGSPQAADYFSKQHSSTNRSLKTTPTSSIFCQNFPKTPKFSSKTSPNLRKILIFYVNYAIIIVEKEKEERKNTMINRFAEPLFVSWKEKKQ